MIKLGGSDPFDRLMVIGYCRLITNDMTKGVSNDN